jgi:hypothetical protein
MARKGFTGTLFEQGSRLVAKAADAMMNDPRGQEALARAVGLAQRGKRRVEAAQERLMKAAGIPGRQEYQDLARQLARIKRKARELAERLDREDAAQAGGGEPDEADEEPVGEDAGARGSGSDRGER